MPHTLDVLDSPCLYLSPMSKPRLTVVVLGHAGAGKSALVDRLTGAPEKAVPTVDCRVRALGSALTLLDAPGRRSLAKSAIAATSQADAALLVVPAAVGAFETAYAKSGQLREQALVTYALGVTQLVVAVNQMDHETVAFDPTRFLEIKQELAAFLTKIGFKEGVAFVPVSARQGDHVTERSAQMPWHTGGTLVQALEALAPPARPSPALPLRFSVHKVHQIKEVGTVVVGRVVSGTLRVGMTVAFAPRTDSAVVQSIEVHRKRVDSAEPGDYVGVHVQGAHARRGMVMIDDSPLRPVVSFEAQILVLDHPGRLVAGYTPVLHAHAAHAACRVTKLLKLLNKRTGEAMQAVPPTSLQIGQMALCELVPVQPTLCVETFAACAPLGRFVLRDLRRIVAVGVVKAIRYDTSSSP